MATKAEKREALESLTRMIKPGTRLMLTVSHVSRSGMFRHVRAMIPTADGHLHPNYSIAAACGYRAIRGGYRDAIGVGGCGFSVTVDIADAVARTLGMQIIQSATISGENGKRIAPRYVKRSANGYGFEPARRGEPGALPALYMEEF